MPASTSVAMMAAINFEFASTASLTVLALVVTPLVIGAESGTALTLPSPTTMIRACRSGRDCCAAAGGRGEPAIIADKMEAKTMRAIEVSPGSIKTLEENMLATVCGVEGTRRLETN